MNKIHYALANSETSQRYRSARSEAVFASASGELADNAGAKVYTCDVHESTNYICI